MYGGAKHLDGVLPTIRGILYRRTFHRYLPQRTCPEDRVGDRMRYRIRIRMSHERNVARNANAPEDQRTSGGEPMRIVSDTDVCPRGVVTRPSDRDRIILSSPRRE